MIRHSTNRASRLIALLAMVGTLSLLGPVSLAQAGDATKAQYGDEVTQVAGNIGGGGGDPADPAQPSGLQKRVVGGLPFTGLDVVALLAVAVALTSTGLALRRLAAGRHIS
jgi:hypothetical protein